MSKKEEFFSTHLVGHDILTEIPVFNQDTTVSKAQNELVEKSKEWKNINYIYLTNNKHKLVGVLSIKELFQAAKRKKLKSVATKELVTARPYTHKERASMLAIRSNLKQVPIVSKTGRLLGVFGSDQVVQTLHQANVEDILRFSGVTPPDQMQFRTLVNAGVSRLVHLRAPWLLLGLAGGIAATFVIGYFEQTLAEILALAFFIPVVVYMGDAVGHQTQLIYIRSLGSDNLNTKNYLLRELAVDFIFGIICALAIMVLILFWINSPVAAAIVGITMFLNILKSGAIAIGVPLLLYKMKKDPALGSGPFTTTLQDLLSIFVYFSIASLFLG